MKSSIQVMVVMIPRRGNRLKTSQWQHNGNAGLLKSMDEVLPVRVIRGHTHKSEHSPDKGYTYVGLYCVAEAWKETVKSGFKICRFKLV